MSELENKRMEDDEITLKELIEKLLEYFWYVLGHWKIVAILGVLCVAYFLYQAFTTHTTYKADLTFMVNEDEGGSFGGISGILSNFGISSGAGGKFNLEKILELSKSRKIVQSALLQKCTVDGQEDMIANHIIRLYEYHKQWKKGDNEALYDFYFQNDSLDLLNATENSVLKSMYNRMLDGAGENVEFTSSVSKESGIMRFGLETRSSELSIAFIEALYDELSVYYIEKAVSKQKQTYDLVKSKKDSIAGLLSSKELELALFRDQNRGLFTNKDQLKESVLQREVSMLTLMYAEAVKNLEIADFSLKTKTPFIQSIDRPSQPLYPIFKSKLIAIAKGIFLGGFLGVGFLVIRKILTDTLREDETESMQATNTGTS